MRFLVLLILLAPMAAAEPVTLYLHSTGMQDMPINTQAPDGFVDGRSGVLQQSNCIDVPGVTSMFAQQQHTWYGYASAGAVEYDEDDEGRAISYGWARGLAADARLGPDSTFVFHFLADDTTIPVPEVEVRVTVRASDDVSVGHTAFNDAPLIASGATEPALLAPGLDEADAQHIVVDGRDVYRFEVVLQHASDVIHARDGFNIRIDARIHNAPCDDNAMVGALRPFQAEGHWNTWDIDVAAPVFIEYLHPQLIGDDLVVHAAAQSVFGNYDVVPGTMQVLDASGTDVSALFELVPLTPRTHEHSHELRPMDTAWVVNTTQLADGGYQGTVTVSNLQGTANATAAFAFELGDDVTLCGTSAGEYGCALATTSQQSPGLAFPALIGLLVLGARRL